MNGHTAHNESDEATHNSINESRETILSSMQDEEEERKSDPVKLIVLNSICLFISIAMVILGTQYNSEEYCKNGANQFLLFGGIVEIVLSFVSLLILYLLNFNRIRFTVLVVTNIIAIAVLVWGSVVVFGAYSNWTYKHPFNENYCRFTPFVSALVTIFLQGLLITSILIKNLSDKIVCKSCNLFSYDECEAINCTPNFCKKCNDNFGKNGKNAIGVIGALVVITFVTMSLSLLKWL